jgi:hypothetical protein
MNKLAKTEYNNRIGKVRQIDHDEIHIEENAIPLGDRGREIVRWQHPNVDDEVAFNVNGRDGTLIYLCIISRAKKPTQAPRSEPRECQNICCGQDGGGEMADMSLASQDEYEMFLDGM